MPLRSDASSSLAVGGTEPSRPTTSCQSSVTSSGTGFVGGGDSVAVFGCGSAMIFSFWTAGSSGSFGSFGSFGGAAALSLGSGSSAWAEASAPRISGLVRACPNRAAQTFAANPWADIVWSARELPAQGANGQ